MKPFRFVWVAAAPLALAPAFAAQPRAQEAAAAQEKEPDVYDEKADARADLAAALARAKKENRRVLVQWGANWCHWCRLLHERMTNDRDLARKLLYEYDVVRVDVGRFDKNMQLAAELGADFKSTGIPYLTVLDAGGRPLAQQETGVFETDVDGKQGHDAKRLVEFLALHQAPYLDANVVRAAAFERARAEGKRVFLHFGAPWCGWCKKLEAWMARGEVAPLLVKEFVELKIDTDRMLGGGEMLKAQRTSLGLKESGGIPWIVFFGADGAVLATSEGPQGNIGCPYADEEIAHFVAMLEKSPARLTPDDIAALKRSLVAVREEDEAKKKAREAAGKR